MHIPSVDPNLVSKWMESGQLMIGQIWQNFSFAGLQDFTKTYRKKHIFQKFSREDLDAAQKTCDGFVWRIVMGFDRVSSATSAVKYCSMAHRMRTFDDIAVIEGIARSAIGICTFSVSSLCFL